MLQRISPSRAKGWRLPKDAVDVARAGKRKSQSSPVTPGSTQGPAFSRHSK